MGEPEQSDRPATHEADSADVADQHTPVEDDEETSARDQLEHMRHRSPEAPEADVSEQAIEVVDEDEERR